LFDLEQMIVSKTYLYVHALYKNLDIGHVLMRSQVHHYVQWWSCSRITLYLMFFRVDFLIYGGNCSLPWQTLLCTYYV